MNQTDSHSSTDSLSSATPREQLPVNEQARQSLEEQLSELLQVLFELIVVVHDFQQDGNRLVWNKINAIIEHFQKMDELKNDIDVNIPEEVINFVENGRNPDIFTQGFVERTATENQFTHGKIRAVEDFRTRLSSEFEKAFPDLYEFGENQQAQ